MTDNTQRTQFFHDMARREQAQPGHTFDQISDWIDRKFGGNPDWHIRHSEGNDSIFIRSLFHNDANARVEKLANGMCNVNYNGEDKDNPKTAEETIKALTQFDKQYKASAVQAQSESVKINDLIAKNFANKDWNVKFESDNKVTIRPRGYGSTITIENLGDGSSNNVSYDGGKSQMMTADATKAALKKFHQTHRPATALKGPPT